MITILLIVILLLMASLYANYNLYTKYDNLEKIAAQNEEFIIAIRNRIMSQQSYLRQLDRKGAFESDDEVGYFFKELKKIVNDISINLDIELPDSMDQSEFIDEGQNRSFISSRF